MRYQGKKVLVLGLGESGLAMARWLSHGCATVRVADTREAPQRLPLLRRFCPQAEFSGGQFSENLLNGIDFVVVSPGLAPLGELAPILSAAQAADIPVWGEIELFAQALAALLQERGYAPKVIAITGTNGKTTVTRLVGLLCQRAGMKVRVAGNISPPALDVLQAAIDDDALPQVWVLELSSFQLHSCYSLQADAATVLNVTQDHLDWHGTMEAYAADKARIFGAATVRVLNRDDSRVMQMSPPGGAAITFGADAPRTADCFGLQQERGIIWLATVVAAESPEKRRRKNQPGQTSVSISHLMPADALKIRGQHNAANALAALALCRAIGLPLAPLLHGLREYQGEPHRLELVSTLGGVEYYDDSKGTNVGATSAALNGLGTGLEAGRRLVLIAGGDGKGQDFCPLAEPVARYGRAVLLIGKDAERLFSALESTGVKLILCVTLEEAVRRAAALAQAGDIVLMSPACASLDMFNSYVQRAQIFIDAVRELGSARGEVAA